MADEGINKILGGLDSLTNDPKRTEDYSAQVNTLLAEVNVQIQAGRVAEAVAEILGLEKKCRQAADASSVTRLCCRILQIYKDLDNLDEIINYVTILSKKRGQLKASIAEMVHLCMSWLNDAPDNYSKAKLIEALMQVTEGKIFVEVERARLIKILAKQKEDEGNLKEAATLLQDVQLETFGAMERREKAEYILEQIRVLLLAKDYIRCQIVSRKINPKLLEADDFQDIKLQYHKYMIEYFLHEKQIMDVCKAYRAIYNTKCIKEDVTKATQVLQSYVLYLLFAPHDNEQSDLLHKLRVSEKKLLSEIPTIRRILDDFLTIELIPLPLEYEEKLKEFEVFKDVPYVGGTDRWNIFMKRIFQHNIRVIGSYYSRITLTSMCQMLASTAEAVENEVSDLVSSGFLQARLDRPAGVVTFGKSVDSCDLLNNWVYDMRRVLNLVEEASHLIQKEKMIHEAALSRSKGHRSRAAAAEK